MVRPASQVQQNKPSAELQKALGYEFAQPELLEEALRHSSAVKVWQEENPQSSFTSNERLEFLGDSVLGLVITHELIQRQQTLQEGDLSKIRAALVNEKSLFQLARDLGLGEYLYLSWGEEKGRGRTKPSVLADAVEALIGALYLDGGLSTARYYILKWFHLAFKKPLASYLERDYKTALQELTQSWFKQAPDYHVVQQQGPQHAATFYVEVCFNDIKLGTGEGHSKKAASQLAAQQALQALQSNPDLLKSAREHRP